MWKTEDMFHFGFLIKIILELETTRFTNYLC